MTLTHSILSAVISWNFFNGASAFKVCYNSLMKKPSLRSDRERTTSGMTLGRERFAKISAVEGIVLTAVMKKRAADFDRRGLSGEERRRTIIRAYRKG